MTASQESLRAKYARLLQAIKRLESIRKEYSRLDSFLEDFKAHDTVLYNLVIGVEAITDISNHILAAKFQDYSEHYRDILLKLGDHKIVPKEFAKKTADMANFRNLAIHVYEALTLEEVYRILQHAPEDFRTYAKALEPHLKESSDNNNTKKIPAP